MQRTTSFHLCASAFFEWGKTMEKCLFSLLLTLCLLFILSLWFVTNNHMILHFFYYIIIYLLFTVLLYFIIAITFTLSSLLLFTSFWYLSLVLISVLIFFYCCFSRITHFLISAIIAVSLVSSLKFVIVLLFTLCSILSLTELRFW